jgi:polyhydroxyalkanoate synthesis regulator phasin
MDILELMEKMKDIAETLRDRGESERAWRMMLAVGDVAYAEIDDIQGQVFCLEKRIKDLENEIDGRRNMEE